MTTITNKSEYTMMATIYNQNLKKIRLQLNRQELAELKQKYNVESGRFGDSHLAKKLMLKGIQL